MATTVVATRDDFLDQVMYPCNDSDCADNNYTDSGFRFCITYEIDIKTVILMVYFSLVTVVGLYGNTLVIYIILRYAKMRTVTNAYILNLAVADTLFLSGVVPTLWTMGVGSWQFGNAMCKVSSSTEMLNYFASSIFLTVMSVDRYIAVCYPLKCKAYRTTFVSKVVCIAGWTMSFVMIVPVLMYTAVFTSPCGNSCYFNWPHAEHIDGETVFILYTFTLGFAIPLVLMSVFSSLVIRKLYEVGPRNSSNDRNNTHHKVTKLVLTIIIVYVLCWLPFWVGKLVLLFTPPSQMPIVWADVYSVVVYCVYFCNSAINPILYAYLSDKFRKSFLQCCLHTVPET